MRTRNPRRASRPAVSPATPARGIPLASDGTPRRQRMNHPTDLNDEDHVEHLEHDRSILRWALAPLVAVAALVFFVLSLWSLLSLIPLLLIAIPACYIYFRTKRDLDDAEESEHEALLEANGMEPPPAEREAIDVELVDETNGGRH